MDLIARSERLRAASTGASTPARLPPSDCTREELTLLCHLAETEFVGHGSIFDLGCGNGGSTACLAHGLVGNPVPEAQESVVHAYDWFDACADGIRAHAHIERFEQCVAPYRSRVELVSANILECTYPGAAGGAEILFVDISKTERTFLHVQREFASKLLPGGILIQQDFGRPRLSWLHYSTMLLLDHVEVEGVVDDSLVCRILRPLTREVIERSTGDQLTVAERAACVRDAADLFSGVTTKGNDYRDILVLSEVFTWLHGGDRLAARKRMNAFSPSDTFVKSFRVMLDQVSAALG